MNARGIPTAVYQVLHLLSEVGYPPSQVWWGGTQGGGTPPSRSTPSQVWQGGYPRQGTPPARSDRGCPRWSTPPSQVWQGGYQRRGIPLARSDRGYPWWGTPRQWYPPSWTWLGYPPLPAGVNWQTKWNYNLPSRTTYAVGNKCNVTRNERKVDYPIINTVTIYTSDSRHYVSRSFLVKKW